MKHELTQAQLKKLLAYDLETGVFTWLVYQGPQKPGTVAGNRNNRGYLKVQINRCTFLIHRLAWLYVYGVYPKFSIDHIDNDRLNNRIANLRVVTSAINAQNQTTRKRKDPSIPIGVFQQKSGNYSAAITRNYKSKWLGTFPTKEEAAAAYLAAKRKIHHESPNAAIYTISAESRFR